MESLQYRNIRFGDAEIYECKICGAIISDKHQHSEWHALTGQ
ncbi:MAG: hypothetical protein QW136_03760 [Nitrososphaerales archaeon]